MRHLGIHLRASDKTQAAPFAPLDMDDHPLVVDIHHLLVVAFLQPQPTAANRSQPHLTANNLHTGQDQAYLVNGEDDWQSLFFRRSHQLKSGALSS